MLKWVNVFLAIGNYFFKDSSECVNAFGWARWFVWKHFFLCFLWKKTLLFNHSSPNRHHSDSTTLSPYFFCGFVQHYEWKKFFFILIIAWVLLASPAHEQTHLIEVLRPSFSLLLFNLAAVCQWSEPNCLLQETENIIIHNAWCRMYANKGTV